MSEENNEYKLDINKRFLALVFLILVSIFAIAYLNHISKSCCSDTVDATPMLMSHAPTAQISVDMQAVVFGYEQCPDKNLKQCFYLPKNTIEVRLNMDDGSIVKERWRTEHGMYVRPNGYVVNFIK